MWLFIPLSSAQVSACSAKASELHLSYLASGIEPFATWNVKPLLPHSLSRLWRQEPLIRRLSGLTSPPSTVQHGADQWIALLRASHVKTCQSRASELGSMVRAQACSSLSSMSPTLAVRSSSFWRTSQASLLPPPPLWTKKKVNLKSERHPESWENWPTAGGTRSGSLFQRPTWAPPMDERAGSALHGGWATLNAHDGRRPGADLHSTQGANLSRDAALWATPTTMAAKGVGYQRQANGTNTPILSGQAEHWPTPSASVANDGESPETWHARAALLKLKHGNGNGVGMPLTIAAVQWPTPASRDFRTPNSQESQESQERRNHTGGEQLPNFVEHHFSHQAPATLNGPELLPTGPTSRRRLNPAFGCC